MKEIFEKLIDTNIRPFLPPHAMLEVIRSEEIYKRLVENIENNLLKQKDIESFVEECLEDFKKGKSFRYNQAFSILAVSINGANDKFENDFYVKGLVELNSLELGDASRVAEACIKE